MPDKQQGVTQAAQKAQSKAEEKGTVSAYVPQEVIDGIEEFCEIYDVNKSQAIAYLLDQSLPQYTKFSFERARIRGHEILEDPELAGFIVRGEAADGTGSTKMAIQEASFDESNEQLREFAEDLEAANPDRPGEAQLTAVFLLADVFTHVIEYAGVDPDVALEAIEIARDDAEEYDDLEPAEQLWFQLFYAMDSIGRMMEVNE